MCIQYTCPFRAIHRDGFEPSVILILHLPFEISVLEIRKECPVLPIQDRYTKINTEHKQKKQNQNQIYLPKKGKRVWLDSNQPVIS